MNPCSLFAAALCLVLLGHARAGAADLKPEVAAKIEKALPAEAPAKPAKARKVLIYTRANGFVHGSIPIGAAAMETMGKKTGAYESVISDDPAVFEADKLKDFDGIILVSTTGNFLVPRDLSKKPPEEQKAAKEAEVKRKAALLDFVSGGKGLIGIHAATDAYYGWAEYGKMIGGYFNGHPWGKIHVRIEDAGNPVNAQFEGKAFDFSDEIYTFKDPYARDNLRVLLSIDLEKSGITKGENRKDHDYAVAWLKPYGKGRIFYTLLGHRNETFMNPLAMRYFLAGTQYALGDLKAEDAPSAKPPAGK